jgi:hypothetical protein
MNHLELVVTSVGIHEPAFVRNCQSFEVWTVALRLSWWLRIFEIPFLFVMRICFKLPHCSSFPVLGQIDDVLVKLSLKILDASLKDFTVIKVKLSLRFFKLSTTPWRRIGEWRYSSTHSLTSALDGCEWSASRPGRFNPRERTPGTHWIGGWVGSRSVLGTVMKRKIWKFKSRSWFVTPVSVVVGYQRFFTLKMEARRPRIYRYLFLFGICIPSDSSF